ncbi:MAG: dephospho-CoA kinase [Gammaproteobacteria bacterium]|nr:dephospho-CoA kinase [Gammaproteobacteria bacterium]
MNRSSQHSRFVVGLTGGIGSGKTTVANLFSRQGIEIIDADEISRTLVKTGSPALEAIIKHFGSSITDAEGNLDRKQLRELVFADNAEKEWLENLLHPLVRQEIQRQVAASSSQYVIIVVPLLLESENYSDVDRILVIDVPEDVQLERIKKRDGSSETLARSMMDAQMKREGRLESADDVISNNSSMDSLEKQVKNLHHQYLQLSVR